MERQEVIRARGAGLLAALAVVKKGLSHAQIKSELREMIAENQEVEFQASCHFNAPAWDGQGLPPIDSTVEIDVASQDNPQACKVTGYEVAPALDGSDHYRVFVTVAYLGSGTKNSRLLGDVRPCTSRAITEAACV